MVMTGDSTTDGARTLHIQFYTGNNESFDQAPTALNTGVNPELPLEVYHDLEDVHPVTWPKS